MAAKLMRESNACIVATSTVTAINFESWLRTKAPIPFFSLFYFLLCWLLLLVCDHSRFFSCWASVLFSVEPFDGSKFLVHFVRLWLQYFVNLWSARDNFSIFLQFNQMIRIIRKIGTVTDSVYSYASANRQRDQRTVDFLTAFILPFHSFLPFTIRMNQLLPSPILCDAIS